MIYHRFNNSNTPYNDVCYMMFCDDELRVEHYGKNHWQLDLSQVPAANKITADSVQFQQAVREWLEDNIENLREKSYDVDSESFIEMMVSETNPFDIVDSAGFWDCPDIMAAFCDEVINDNEWWVVTTQNGAICFDPELVQAA